MNFLLYFPNSSICQTYNLENQIYIYVLIMLGNTSIMTF